MTTVLDITNELLSRTNLLRVQGAAPDDPLVQAQVNAIATRIAHLPELDVEDATALTAVINGYDDFTDTHKLALKSAVMDATMRVARG